MAKEPRKPKAAPAPSAEDGVIAPVKLPEKEVPTCHGPMSLVTRYMCPKCGGTQDAP